MYLDSGDEKILNGEEGETRQQLMEILVAVGKIFDADRMVPIRSAQISGASYKTIGEYGLEWLSNLDAKVSVPSILNPIGMDRFKWRDMAISEEFAEKQLKVVSAYERLGIRLECTCTPYYLTITEYGDHLAWSESSAVSYANSVIGARTNREGGPSALAAAIIGKTPNYGLHLVNNRTPDLVFEVESVPDSADQSWYGALGFLAGKIAGNRIPYFSGIRPNRDQLKNLGAAMAASGAVALYHVEDITPESKIFHYEISELEKIPITTEMVRAVFTDEEPEAVAIGCPHLSPGELEEIAGRLENCRVKRPLYIFASRQVFSQAPDLVAQITQSGAMVFADTCMVVSPSLERYASIMVNSGKAFSYVPTMCGARAILGSLDQCIETACK